MLPRTLFDSAHLPEGDGFEAWRESIAPVFDVSPLPGEASAHARVEGFHLGDMLAGTVQASSQRFRQAIRSQRVDHILIQVHRAGGYSGRLGEQDTRVAAGQVSVIDLARPLETQAGATDIVNLVIPREAFDERPAALNGMHGLVLPRERGSFLADYLQSLVRRLPSLAAADAPALAAITRDMVLANLAPESEARARVQPQLQTLAHERVKRFIEMRLHLPDLTPAAICRANGLSRSGLYRLFEPEGGVQRYIQQRRLRRIRQHLQDPDDGRSIGALAEVYGFSDPAHLSRRFRLAFGDSPSDLRRSRNGDLPRMPNDGAQPHRLDDWLRQLGL